MSFETALPLPPPPPPGEAVPGLRALSPDDDIDIDDELTRFQVFFGMRMRITNNQGFGVRRSEPSVPFRSEHHTHMHKGRGKPSGPAS